jgi:hypothetical protein
MVVGGFNASDEPVESPFLGDMSVGLIAQDGFQPEIVEALSEQSPRMSAHKSSSYRYKAVPENRKGDDP